MLVPAPSTIAFAGPYASVTDLPVPGDTNILYLVGTSAPYQIYSWIDGEYVLVGSTSIDLSDYYTKEEVDADFLKRQNDGSSLCAYTHEGEIQGDVPVSQAAAGNAIARYKPGGTLAVGDATSGEDAINLSTLDTNFLRKSGGTMTGSLILKGAPAQDLEAATKKYVDDNSGGGGGTMDHSQLNNRDMADQHPIAAISNLTEIITNIDTALADLAAAIAGGGYGTFDHAALTNRDIDNQHPIAAITGLDDFTRNVTERLSRKLDRNLGGDNAGKFLSIDLQGNIVPVIAAVKPVWALISNVPAVLYNPPLLSQTVADAYANNSLSVEVYINGLRETAFSINQTTCVFQLNGYNPPGWTADDIVEVIAWI